MKPERRHLLYIGLNDFMGITRAIEATVEKHVQLLLMKTKHIRICERLSAGLENMWKKNGRLAKEKADDCNNENEES